jgi:hypothetical membrane protein
VCWSAAGVSYLGLEALAASAFPGYRYSHDVISTLGTPESPLRWAMNTAFVVQGSLFFAGAILLTVARRSRKPLPLLLCAGSNAAGNIMVASVPSGAGWPHVAGAGLAIVGGNAAILAGSRHVILAGSRHVGRSRRYLLGSAVAGGAGLVALALFATTGSAAAERLSVYTIIGWQLASALIMLSAAERPSCCHRDLRRTRTAPTENPERE